ncbi:hypothetical protein SEPL_041 [Salmonella phage SE_PL]|uniref:hypothetical protein n=1 Tax=Salmonella enterica TaxID=28901 RepID=UPI000FDF9D89|nr:hypothetical protein CPT_Munch_387 [Salmonella phage Munch]EAZ2022677.1 hypothetical protein [Salmonella enterica]ECV9083811.1 hypothetical protein [Salmonella enterica subsp. enterica serovar Infantis]MCP0435597.1 hypothetical protein [Salmonella enterica subsp. enterica serovar Mbandaka]QIG62654.1 hypothetical protein SEPL_041 [Salmonella phage SE_PL]WNV47493.1 hypothetical protein [Klebsiella phage fENko-Kae01]
MDKFKQYTIQLYNNCTELIADVHRGRRKFRNIYESTQKVIFEDLAMRTVQLSSNELVLKFENISIYFRDNIIQFCLNQISYVHDVIYIPNNKDFSFYEIYSECDLFQLSTVVDTKLIRFEDIDLLNRIKSYFEYRHLENNI